LASSITTCALSELLTSDVGHDQNPWHHRPPWTSSAMLGLGFFFAMVLFFLG
jgi:hypothetical protein